MYVDLLFVLNFMMDMMVLFLTGWVLGLELLGKRLVTAASAGAFVGCLFTVVSQGMGVRFFSSVPGELLCGIGLCVVMVRLGFAPRTGQAWIREVLAVYGISFLLGGMLSWIQQQVSPGDYVVTVAAAFLVFCLGQVLYKKVKAQEQAICKVSIQMGESVIHGRGLWDTGNLLTMPGTGTPVTVVGIDVMEKAMSKVQQEQYDRMMQTFDLPENGDWHWIPYRSVGCPSGLLPVLRVSNMVIHTETGDVWIQKAFLGICPHPVSGSNAYEMILNPKLRTSRQKGVSDNGSVAGQ